MNSYCVSKLRTGTCGTQGCQYRHDVAHCAPCGRYMHPENLDAHLNGGYHRSVVDSDNGPAVQQASTLSQADISDASNTFEVRKNKPHMYIRLISPLFKPFFTVVSGAVLRCKLCKTCLSRDGLGLHKIGKEHLDKVYNANPGLSVAITDVSANTYQVASTPAPALNGATSADMGAPESLEIDTRSTVRFHNFACICEVL
jgi:hypothetical protein